MAGGSVAVPVRDLLMGTGAFRVVLTEAESLHEGLCRCTLNSTRASAPVVLGPESQRPGRGARLHRCIAGDSSQTVEESD